MLALRPGAEIVAGAVNGAVGRGALSRRSRRDAGERCPWAPVEAEVARRRLQRAPDADAIRYAVGEAKTVVDELQALIKRLENSQRA